MSQAVPGVDHASQMVPPVTFKQEDTGNFPEVPSNTS